jgi:hypothetical protein
LEAAKSAVVYQGQIVRRSPERLKNVHAGSDVSGEFNRNQISKFDQSMGQTPVQRVLNPIGVVSVLGLYLNVSYPPVPGLVAVFGRASSTPGNPRKPLVNPCIASGLSYAVVVMQPTENNRSSREFGYQQRVRGSVARQGSGQGAMFGRGGFPTGEPRFPPRLCMSWILLWQFRRSIWCKREARRVGSAILRFLRGASGADGR